jgi:hypothetical protein
MTSTTDRAEYTITKSEQVGDLVARLSLAMGEVGYVAQTGKADQRMGGYSYASDEDLILAVRPALVKHGIVMIPNVEPLSTREIKTRNNPMHCLMVRYSATLHFGEQWITASTLGEGSDMGDKASYKAQTGALKYLLRGVFLIATGDDPERATQQPVSRETPQRQPQQAMPSRNVIEALKGAAQVLVDIRAFLDVDEAHASLKRAAYHMAGRDPAAMTTGHVNEALAAIQEERLG